MPSKSLKDAPQRLTPFVRRESLGYQVNHLARLLAAALKQRIEPHGVLPGQFAQLLALLEEDGISQSDLCERVQIDQSTMALTLKRMERGRLVTRSKDPADQRRIIVNLTSHARALAPALVGAAQDVNATASAGVPPKDLEVCLRVLARLIDNLQGVETQGDEGSP